MLWNRDLVGRPQISGDPAVMQLWHERAKIKWR
jgi:hypothetical protein